jgi:hypothetical protein
MIKADIYRNLNVPKNQDEKWSVLDRTTRRVNGIISSALVKDVRFVVQPAGHARVVKEGRKNVHAFVRGNLIESPLESGRVFDRFFKDENPNLSMTKVSYNPYKANHFVREDTGEAIHEADMVWITPSGVYMDRN